MNTFLIGADPELFVKKNGSFISAHTMVPGSKAAPYKVEKGAVQPDGLAAEFNIDPAEKEDDFVENIATVLSQLRSMIDGELTISSVAHFPAAYIDGLPETATVLGCDPDYNAYTGEPNEPPPQHPTMRTASGHVHIGWGYVEDPFDPVHFEACRQLARELDFRLGFPALVLDKKGGERRKMYGKAGCFRPKKYGMEYRTLSNFWLANEAYTRWVFRGAKKAINSLMENKGELTMDTCIVQSAIDDTDTLKYNYFYNLYKHWIKEYNLLEGLNVKV